ncbi:MAG TPA: hypothetical protein VEV17_18955 [Bryobacteraceae bacterium]|nr:hypothetical protein [Bryobacteraceae bacterium]
MFKPATGIVVSLFAFSASAQAPIPATDVTAAQIQAFVKALPRDAVNDRPIRVVDVGGYHVGVYGVFRPKASTQEAILHETKVTEVYQMLEGVGTLVTGGTIVNGKRTQAPSIGHASVRGPRIEGGVSRRVVKGDVIIIPGGTPHWWSNLEGDITYLIIRPDPEATIPLK